jgi:DNA-binding transcriptional MerR regulator
MKYKIGEVSKFFGISPDLLRYYEKKNVIKPTRDNDNNYRYYDSREINVFLCTSLWYKSFGFSVEQTSRIAAECSCSDLLSLMEEKKNELQRKIDIQRLLLQRAHEHIGDIKRTEELLGKCEIALCPASVRYINKKDFIFDNSKQMQKINQQWQKYMPFTYRCVEVTPKEIQTGGGSYTCGYSLNMDYVKEFDVKIEPPLIAFSSQPCIHSAVRHLGRSPFSPHDLDYILDFARENDLILTGNVYGNVVCNFVDEGNVTTGLIEIWAPIEG